MTFCLLVCKMDGKSTFSQIQSHVIPLKYHNYIVFAIIHKLSFLYCHTNVLYNYTACIVQLTVFTCMSSTVTDFQVLWHYALPCHGCGKLCMVSDSLNTMSLQMLILSSSQVCGCYTCVLLTC